MSIAIGDALRRPAVQIMFGVHAAVAIALCFVPLFDVLGFERAFVTGLAATITSPIVAITLIRRARDQGGADLARVAAHALLLNLGMLLPSLFAGLLVEAFSTPCDPEEGLLFMFLCAGGNAFFGTMLGLFAGTLAHRRGLPGIIVAAVLIAFFTIALRRLYAEPQIFIYSVPFGFWPGSIYDERLAVDTTLVAFRGYTLFYGLTIAALVRAFVDREQLILTLASPRLTAASGIALLAAVTISFHRSGEELGFDLTRATIERELSRKVVTEELEIYIDPSVTPDQVERIVLDHRFRYDQLARFFDFRPDTKIKSFVYRDSSQKQRLMGAGDTQISRPWAAEIHIDGFDYPHPVLKHELAHAFSAKIASGLFKVPASGAVLVNIGIVEGLAVAADWRSSEMTVHGWTRAMRALELAPDLRNTLDIAGFWSISSARAYTVAGSFVRFLIDEHGMEKFAALYSTNDFHRAYGRPLDALVTDWEHYIDSLPLPQGDLLIAEHRFKRPGIFQKVCAHKAANISARGYGRLRSGDADGALEDLLALLELAPNDPAPLIALSSGFARQDRLADAKRLAEQALGIESATQKSSASAREALANVQWQLGELESAREGYEQVLTLHLSTASDRVQIARLAALQRPSDLQATLREYLIGELPTGLALVRLGDAARAHPTDALVRYLYAKNLEAIGAIPEAITSYGDALAGELPGKPLEREAKMALGRLLLAAGRTGEAEAAFRAIALSESSPAMRLEASDWADRAAFLQTTTATAAE
jgi:tetratricopeptide (TPR) repeat protein